MSEIRVNGWYLEQRNPAANVAKQYTVLISETGVVVLAWGRIGQAGQKKIQKLPFPSADALGKKQMYSKQSGGYAVVQDEFIFHVDSEVLDKACRHDLPDPLLRAFHLARSDPKFIGEQKSVIQHYDDFVNKAQRLLESSGDRPFEDVYNEFEELEQAWGKITEAHDAAAVTVDLTKQMLKQRLFA